MNVTLCARPTQQFYYARRFCVPWVKAAQIMRDIMRDSISLSFYHARCFCVPWVKAAQIVRDMMRDSISPTFYYARSAWC